MKRLLWAILLGILMAFPSAARADMAPPAHPPGSSLEPGAETTQVRMLAETVLIEVQASAPQGSLGQAHVTADFTLRNLGTESETMAARFPIGASDGFFAVNQLSDLQVRLNGKAASTRPITGEDPYGSSELVPWVEFDVTFPPAQDVQAQVKYTLEATGEYPFVWFKYILASGAGWRDSIGSADLIVRLPYEANDQNVLTDPDQTYYSTSPGGSFAGDAITWHHDDLEPVFEDNFEVELVMPSAWEMILTERRNVEKNPGDGETWGRLGKLYKEMTFSSRGKGFRHDAEAPDAGAAELYQLSVQAYEKSVELLPKDALWHAGFAELLAYHAYFSPFSGENTIDEALRGLGEIHTALELAPADSKVVEIAEEISSYFPQGMERDGAGFAFPWLTAAPPPPTPDLAGTSIARFSLTATAEAQGTPTAPAASTGTPAPGARGGRGLPFCGGALVAPVLLFSLLLPRRGRAARV